jgi:hypothetical protein
MRVIATVRFYLELPLTTSAVMPPNGSHFFGRRRYIPSLRYAMNSSRLAVTEFRVRSSGYAARREADQGNSERQSPVELQWAGG